MPRSSLLRKRQSSKHSECGGPGRNIPNYWECDWNIEFEFQGCCTYDACLDTMNGVFCARENPGGVIKMVGNFTKIDYAYETLTPKIDPRATAFTVGTFEPTSTRGYISKSAFGSEKIATTTTTAFIGTSEEMQCMPALAGDPTRLWYSCHYDGYAQPFGGCCSKNACAVENEDFCKVEVEKMGLGTKVGVKATASWGSWGDSRTTSGAQAKETDDVGAKTTNPADAGSTTAAASSGGDSGSSKTTTIGIAAGVAGGVLVIAIIAGVVFWVLWRKKKAAKKAAAAEISATEYSGVYPPDSKAGTGTDSRRSSGWFSRKYPLPPIPTTILTYPTAGRNQKEPMGSPRSPGFTESTIPPPIVELDDTETIMSSSTASKPLPGPPRYSNIYAPGQAYAPGKEQQPAIHEMAGDNNIVASPTSYVGSPLIGLGVQSPTFSEDGNQSWGGGSSRVVSDLSQGQRSPYGDERGAGGYHVQS